jgi:hypothetical protein
VGRNRPEISKILLQEGADPNFRDADSTIATALEEGLTAWTGLLQDGLYVSRFDGSWVEYWILTVKVFLKYGADPTVRWYSPHGTEDRQAVKINTPETAIKAVSARYPQHQKDFAEIMELLSEAKAKPSVLHTPGRRTHYAMPLFIKYPDSDYLPEYHKNFKVGVLQSEYGGQGLCSTEGWILLVDFPTQTPTHPPSTAQPLISPQQQYKIAKPSRCS